jgi:nicotinamide mononucleotide transporter
MEHFLDILEAIKSTSYWEWQAIVFGVLYLIFAIKEKLICWAFAFINSATYVYVSYTAKLHLDALLQVFYVIMAVIGFVNWNKPKNETVFQQLPMRKHVMIIAFTMLVSILLGTIFARYTSQVSPYVDATTTCFSLVATYMTAKKIVENWLYFVVVDSIMVYLYFTRDLKMSSVLMLFYTLMAINGYIHWRKLYYQQLKGA